MKLSSFKALQQENPRTAMIFDLSERFPRGPKAKLRKRDYNNPQWEEPSSEKLIGGELGYDMFELYELSKGAFYTSDMERLTTNVEGAGMGRFEYVYNNDGERVRGTTRHLFKTGPQITRRIRRLESRLRGVRRAVENASSANLYRLRVGGINAHMTLFGDSEEHAKQQFELLLSSAFLAGIPSGAVSSGYYSDDSQLRTSFDFAGPSHGAHEIMKDNQDFVNQLEIDNSRRREKIEKLQQQIAATNDIMSMVDTFTINSCVQQGFDVSEKS